MYVTNTKHAKVTVKAVRENFAVTTSIEFNDVEFDVGNKFYSVMKQCGGIERVKVNEATVTVLFPTPLPAKPHAVASRDDWSLWVYRMGQALSQRVAIVEAAIADVEDFDFSIRSYIDADGEISQSMTL